MSRIDSSAHNAALSSFQPQTPEKSPAAPAAAPAAPATKDSFEAKGAAVDRSVLDAKSGTGKKKKNQDLPPPFKGVPEGTQLRSSVPGSDFHVSGRGFPVGTTKVVNGKVELPGLGVIDAPKKAGKKGEVAIQIDKKHVLKIRLNKDGTVSVSEGKIKKGGLLGGVFGKVLRGVLAVASFIPVVNAVAIPASIGLAAYDAAQSFKNGDILGGVASVAGAVAGGVGTFARVAGSTISAGTQATLNTVKNVATTVKTVSGAVGGVINGIKTGDYGGVIGGVANAAGAVTDLTGAPAGVNTAIDAAKGVGNVVSGLQSGNLLAAGQAAIGVAGEIPGVKDAVVSAADRIGLGQVAGDLFNK